MSQQRLPGTEVTIERDVPAPMRDGTVLMADVYRPDTEEPLPVLLARSPYGKTANLSTFGNAHPHWFAQQGYVVVMQDSRGRFESEVPLGALREDPPAVFGDLRDDGGSVLRGHARGEPRDRLHPRRRRIFTFDPHQRPDVGRLGYARAAR